MWVIGFDLDLLGGVLFQFIAAIFLIVEITIILYVVFKLFKILKNK